jgi:predicted N-acetyltransferase YhbS
MRIIIEAEAKGDFEQIARLHTLAFNRDVEARLVEKLRKTPNYVHELSLVGCG